MPKLPTRGCHVVGGNGPSVTGGDLKGEALAIHVAVTLPILPPVLRHGLPPCVRPLDRHRFDVASTSHVGDQNQVEVGVAVDCEPYASFPRTGHSIEKQQNRQPNQSFSKKKRQPNQ